MAKSSTTSTLTALNGLVPVAPSGGGGRHAPEPVSGAGQAALRPGLVPWAKAGIILTASTRPGAAYAAMLVTAAHGVRMQDDMPAQGFLPLAPWAGLAVLCAWAVLALRLAVLRLRRADA